MLPAGSGCLLIFKQNFYLFLMLWGAKFSGKVKVKFRKHLNMCASRAFGWLHPLPFHHPNFLGLEFMLWGLESPVEFALHALVQLFCTLSPWFVLFVEINCATLSSNNVCSGLGWAFSAWQHPEVPVDGELWRRLQTFPVGPAPGFQLNRFTGKSPFPCIRLWSNMQIRQF